MKFDGVRQTLHGPIGDHTSSFRTECVALWICLEYIRTTYLSNLPMGPVEARICTDSLSAVCALEAGYLRSLGLPSFKMETAYVAVSGHLIQTIESIHLTRFYPRICLAGIKCRLKSWIHHFTSHSLGKRGPPSSTNICVYYLKRTDMCNVTQWPLNCCYPTYLL